MTLTEKVRAITERYVRGKVAAAVSGGRDSMCLLDCLLRFSLVGKRDLTVIHVNHMIRGADADADEKLVARLIEADLSERYPGLTAAALEAQDRGTRRICVWGEKVARMVQSLLNRYEQEGEAFLEENDVWLCTVCGFIYVGKSAPTLCQVCKVPDWKFEKIEGRA